jgi:hypothetical protein
MAKTRRRDTFELPCGFLTEEGTLHKTMTVLALDHKTDKAMSDGMTTSELVANHTACIGTIQDAEGIKAAVPQLEKGDFDYALIRLRILSLGEMYEYPQLCPNKTCKFEGVYEYDLEEIDVVEMPDPHVRTVEYTTDDDRELVFRTLKAQDMEDLADLMKDPDDQISRILGLQLVSIDGVTPADELRKKGRKCKNASQQVRQAIRMMDELEIEHGEKEKIRKAIRAIIGYPDRKVRGVCPECGANFGHLLPIDYTFIVPSLEAAIQHGSL